MDAVTQQGFFSLLRWRPDPTRDEARNIAILLVVPGIDRGLLRAAPLNSISPRLHEQGIVDELLAGLEQRLSGGNVSIDLLSSLHQEFQRSLLVTEPQPVALADPDADMAALYRAYLAQRSGGSRVATKGSIRERVTKELRRRGFAALVGQYVEDFLFDVVIQNGHPLPTVVEVLSFAGERKDWTPVEQDAGHFLYACHLVDVEAHAVVAPPTGDDAATASYERVSRWFENESIRTVSFDEFLETPQQSLELANA